MSTYTQVRHLAYLLDHAEKAGLPAPFGIDIHDRDGSPQLQIRAGEWDAWAEWLDVAGVTERWVERVGATFRRGAGARFDIEIHLLTLIDAEEVPA